MGVRWSVVCGKWYFAGVCWLSAGVDAVVVIVCGWKLQLHALPLGVVLFLMKIEPYCKLGNASFGGSV